MNSDEPGESRDLSAELALSMRAAFRVALESKGLPESAVKAMVSLLESGEFNASNVVHSLNAESSVEELRSSE